MRELYQNSKFCYRLFILFPSLPFTSPANEICRYDTFFGRFWCFFCIKWSILRCMKPAVGQWPKCIFHWFFCQKQNFMTYRLIYFFPPIAFAGFMAKYWLFLIALWYLEDVLVFIEEFLCNVSEYGRLKCNVKQN